MTNMNEYRNMWVYIETECGKAKNVGFELLNAARPLADQKGCELVAVVIGSKVDSAARDAICYGADKAIIVDGPEYEYYSTDAFVNALVAMVRRGARRYCDCDIVNLIVKTALVSTNAVSACRENLDTLTDFEKGRYIFRSCIRRRTRVRQSARTEKASKRKAFSMNALRLLF